MRQHLGKRTLGCGLQGLSFLTGCHIGCFTFLSVCARGTEVAWVTWSWWPLTLSEILNFQLFILENSINIISVCSVLLREKVEKQYRLLANTLDQRNNSCLWDPNHYLVNSTNTWVFSVFPGFPCFNLNFPKIDPDSSFIFYVMYLGGAPGLEKDITKWELVTQRGRGGKYEW